MYFDAVITDDMSPVFNGTPAEVREWLKSHTEAHTLSVCVGATMRVISVPEYLKAK